MILDEEIQNNTQDTIVETVMTTVVKHGKDFLCNVTCSHAYIDDDKDDGFFKELLEDIAEHGQKILCDLMCDGIKDYTKDTEGNA